MVPEIWVVLVSMGSVFTIPSHHFSAGRLVLGASPETAIVDLLLEQLFDRVMGRCLLGRRSQR